MANGHGVTEPETTRTESTRTEEPASRREAMMAGGLQVPSKNRRNSNETHPEKQNSRMMDVPGGEPGSAILANSRKRVGFATTPTR